MVANSKDSNGLKLAKYHNVYSSIEEKVICRLCRKSPKEYNKTYVVVERSPP